MSRSCLILLVLTCSVWASVILSQTCLAVERSSSETELTVDKVLGLEEDQGFSRAVEPRDFSFPADHGPHPQFKTEWWYYTGNLFAENGRHFGYQLTFFRTALSPDLPERKSNWSTNQVYMAHFALTDVETGRFYHFERFSRDSLGLAGAKVDPFKVWLENWRVDGGEGEPLTMVLSASQGDVAIDLRLRNVKPIVLQGENGLSQKSELPGNASYYYSMTRLESSGSVHVLGRTFKVKGLSWLDREWSTSALGENQVGWDWFSLQFDDGTELMYYQLRLKDGSVDPLSSGVLVDKNGNTKKISSDDIKIKVLEHWESQESGAEYPAKWRLDVINEDLSLDIEPMLPDQEMNTTVRYWEGAVSVKSKDRNGYGYVELTGY